MAQSEKKSNFSGSHYKRNSKRRRVLVSLRDSAALPSCLESESKEGVLSALEAVEADAMWGRPVRWCKLIPVLRGMTLNNETAPECLNVAIALLDLFERYRCRDISVLSKVFEVLLLINEFYAEFLRKFVIEYEKIFFLPYGEGQTDVDLVFEAVAHGSLGLLKLQLKFGMGLTMISFSDCATCIQSALLDWSDDDRSEDESTEDYEIPIEDLERGVITRKLYAETIRMNLRRNFNHDTMKRLGLVLRMLNMLGSMKGCRPDLKKHFRGCYRLLFESIPEPFVTSMEVKAALEKCLPASCSRLIPRITQDFENLLPELAEVPQPRSLKHLCRIQVRQSLRSNLNLPSGVSSLPLPISLKKYILLDDDGDYSVIVNASYVYDEWRDPRPDSYISIPERDDCVTSFIKNL